MVFIAFSAVDDALWDLRGKLPKKPVYRLLQKTPRTRLPAASGLSSSRGSNGFPLKVLPAASAAKDAERCEQSDSRSHSINPANK